MLTKESDRSSFEQFRSSIFQTPCNNFNIRHSIFPAFSKYSKTSIECICIAHDIY